MMLGFFVSHAQAEEQCFIAMNAKTGEIVAQKGTICEIRLSPCSTFKIPLSLMGYETQVLQDETHPEWPFMVHTNGSDAEVVPWLQMPKEQQTAQNPTSWMSKSIVWYSQALTTKMGNAKFKEFVERFDYGNKDVSGEPGKNNGLTNAWLSSSLKISPHEQLTFLRKLVNRELSLSPHTYEMTQKLVLIDPLDGGWKFYGKTGSGFEMKPDGTPNRDKQLGWCVGWAQKEDQTYIFAYNIKDVKSIPSMKERQNSAKGYLKEFGLLTKK